MNHAEDAALVNYPRGRGYGHDYMRGGEVLGGYGYAARDEYAKARGELIGNADTPTSDEPRNDHTEADTRT